MFGLRKSEKWKVGDVFDIDGVSIRLDVNTRAKRIILRPDRKTGQMLAIAPRLQLLPDAIKFAKTRANWIKTISNRQTQPTPLTVGETVHVLGKPFVIETGHKKANLTDGTMGLRAHPNRAGIAAVGFLKAMARTHAQNRLQYFADQLGKTISGIRIADPRGRWGSCSSDRRIMLSWRLIMAPDFVFDYVAAHEVCHLVHMDHSDEFWQLLHNLNGPVSPAKEWLKLNGPALQNVGN